MKYMRRGLHSDRTQFFLFLYIKNIKIDLSRLLATITYILFFNDWRQQKNYLDFLSQKQILSVTIDDKYILYRL